MQREEAGEETESEQGIPGLLGLSEGLDAVLQTARSQWRSRKIPLPIAQLCGPGREGAADMGPAGPRAGLCPQPQALQPSCTAQGPGLVAVKLVLPAELLLALPSTWAQGETRRGAILRTTRQPEGRRAASPSPGSQAPQPRAKQGQRLQGAGGHLVLRAQWAPGYRGHPTPRASPGRRQLHSPEGQHVAWGPAPGHREKPSSLAEASLQASAVLSALGTSPPISSHRTPRPPPQLKFP